MSEADQLWCRNAELDRVPGDGVRLFGVLHSIADVLDGITGILSEPYLCSPLRAQFSRKPLFRRVSSGIGVFEHTDGGDSVEIEPSSLGFEVDGVLASMRDDPAFNG